jgi:hypothetical protein
MLNEVGMSFEEVETLVVDVGGSTDDLLSSLGSSKTSTEMKSEFTYETRPALDPTLYES